MTPDERADLGASRPRATIELDGPENLLILEALAGLAARSGRPVEVKQCYRLAQRLEGFSIDARPGATFHRKVPPVPSRVAAGARLLDEHVPGWETRITLPITWARYSPDDPLTQLFHRDLDMTGEAYSRGMKAIGLQTADIHETYDRAAAHGFDTIWKGSSVYGPTADQAHDYRLLADAWTNLIEARLAARTAVTA